MAAVERFMAIQSRYDQMHDALLRRLLACHGELMSTSALTTLLKFGSARSFRRAAGQGHLPFAAFRIDGRRGWFARTVDVAAWLARIQSQHH
jgi:hypothetical protein